MATKRNTKAKSGAAVANWIIAIMLIVIVLTGAALGGLQLFAPDKLKPSTWFARADKRITGVGGLEIKDPAADVASPIMLTSMEIPVALYDAYGIAPISTDSAQQVTATVQPDNYAQNTQLVWEAAFQNASSDWARGKDIEDYITLQYGDDAISSKECTVTCHAAFAEPVTITVSVMGLPQINATVRADYRQRVSDYNLSFGSIDCVWGRNTDVEWGLNDDTNGDGGLPELKVVGSDTYTLAAEYSVKYSLAYEETMQDPLVSGSGSSGNGLEIGFYNFVNSDDTVNGYAEKYDISTYDVAAKGLYFGAKFMYDNMNLKMWSKFMNSKTFNYSFGDIRNRILQAYLNITDTYQWTLNKHLFRLNVEFSANGQSLNKWTSFNITNYKYTVPVSGVTVDNDHIIF